MKLIRPIRLSHQSLYGKRRMVWDHELMSEATLNNEETQGKSGFSVDDIGLEPTTPTMSTCKRIVKNAGKQLGNREVSERLHQCLHQIAKLVKQNQLDTLSKALTDSLDTDSLKRLAVTLIERSGRN